MDVRSIEVSHRHWYRQGQGLVPVRGPRHCDLAGVCDLTGSHRDEYFFSTEIRMSIRRIVESFDGRWDIEVTFEEMREHLGLETTPDDAATLYFALNRACSISTH